MSYKIKIKIKKQIAYLQHHRIYDQNVVVRKYWTKTKCWANSRLCIAVSDVKALFRSPTPFIFVDCNTLLALGLVPFPVSSLPWQVSHSSGISNILGSPKQSRLHLYSFTQWLLWASMQEHPWHTPGLSGFLSCRGRFCNPFNLSLIPKLPSSGACWGWNMSCVPSPSPTPVQLHLINLLFLIVSFIV